ncbi:MAG TPA: LacI family DNA-binding transcriptional regulator [Opitutaceae bacterium]|nr:LacI family DNA-binding transcriptional regulator [Opitutaceae bacterium]
MNVRQIAKLAGVSPSAVSLALRDSPRISAKTKARIAKLAKDAGYAPDARISEFMRQLRKPPTVRLQASFGVVSFYDTLRPWENSRHLARIFEGMTRRAAELGYRLEPLWLRAPGMNYRRFSSIIETRGIDGLLSFGSPDFEEEFPAELGANAVVTLGLSIRTPLHRVTSHFYNDTMHALQRVHRLGYRRPGLVLGTHEETRSAYAHSAAYLGWCERVVGSGSALPVLRINDVERGELLNWISANKPDAIVFVHLPEQVASLRSILADAGLRVPRDLGVAVLSHIVEGTGFSGMQQNQLLMGAWAVELLAARIANNDRGIPASPRIEMVESEWVEGKSLASP